jgi:hypothetical protein
VARHGCKLAPPHLTPRPPGVIICSPVVRAETLRFKEEGVFGVVKDVFLPWYNAYRWGGGPPGLGCLLEWGRGWRAGGPARR